MKVRPETVKLLEENIRKKLLDISFGDNFFEFDNKIKGNKSKNEQVGPHQSKMLLHSKGNHQHNEKKTYKKDLQITYLITH